jgi:hypothetical protein
METEPKGGRHRFVPLPNPALAALARLGSREEFIRDDDPRWHRHLLAGLQVPDSLGRAGGRALFSFPASSPVRRAGDLRPYQHGKPPVPVSCCSPIQRHTPRTDC